MFEQGKSYQVETVPDTQAPSFTGVYNGTIELVVGDAHEFVVQGPGPGCEQAAQWYPVVLPTEIVHAQEVSAG